MVDNDLKWTWEVDFSEDRTDLAKVLEVAVLVEYEFFCKLMDSALEICDGYEHRACTPPVSIYSLKKKQQQ